jgi:exopolysaccharide biosynthesis polyprenyl glycosylphosphotransferase
MAFDEKSRHAGRLLFVLDILTTALVFLFAYWFREFLFSDNPIDFYSHLAMLPFILVPLGFLMSHFGAYQELRVASFLDYSWIVIRSLGISLVILFTSLFLLKAAYASRAFLLIFGVADFMALLMIRAALVWWYFRRAVERGENYKKVLIIGTGERAIRLSQTLKQRSEWGIDVIGYLDTQSNDVGGKVPEVAILGKVEQIGSILKARVVDEVIIAVPRSQIKNAQAIADACEEEGVKLRLMADVFDLRSTRTQLVDLGGIPLLTFEPVAQDERMLVVKRIMDLVATLACLPILLPIFAVVAVAIKLDSPGPVFFTQERVGLRKRVFRMYKFRSMYQDSENKLKEIEHLNEAQGPIFKMTNDPRVTRVGRILRRTSLDELPQLINVIRGHMSLVGPRPMSLRDVNLFDKGVQRKRFSVRPGLTCLWQISGRSNLPFSKWLELDLAYIDNWSLGLDFKILLKTIPVVLKGSGAV